MYKKILILVLLSLVNISSLNAKTSYVSKTHTLHESGSEIYFGVDYFMPSIHSDESGNLVEFDAGESYQSVDLNILGSYGFTSRLQGSVGLRMRYIQSAEVISNEDVVFTQSGVESALVSLKYSFPMEDGMQYSLEANYRSAIYTNDEYDASSDRETIVLGEGGTEASFGIGMTYYTKSQNFFSARGLYKNPASHLSSEIYSEFEYAISWPSTTLYAGVENIYSLGQDPYATTPNDKPQISNGSTYLYNSINRSWTAPYVGLNFAATDKWRIELRALSKLYGISTDLGNTYTIAFVRRKSQGNYFASKNAAFKEYKYEGSVIKITKKRTAVVISIGLKDGIEKGNRVDFYHFDYLGGNQLIASGYAIKVGLSKSIVKITKRYSKLRVEDGTVARSGLIKD